MKNKFTILFLVLMISNGYSQDYAYQHLGVEEQVKEKEVRFGINRLANRPIKQKTVSTAQTLADLISGYPSNWITNYISVEIITNYKGIKRKAIGENEVLSAAQKSILANCDLGTDIIVDVVYDYLNPVTQISEKNNIHIEMTLIPAVQAEFIGDLGGYLRQNGLNKIPIELEAATVLFTINEDGSISDPKLKKTTGTKETDQILIDMVSHMPKWKPAQNANGTNVKQDLLFTVGIMVGC